ncbi:SDR family NAD(P)-dependent oxidoreductase [Thermodesulfobacteriota bacterium]
MLEGKVAVVTGSGRGIGMGIAIKLSEKGSKVAVNDKDEAAVEEVVQLINKKGGTAIGVVADISQKSDANRLMDSTVEEFGRLDILVNNAGEFQGAFLEDMTEAQWDNVLNVDLKGSFLCTQAAAKYMRRGKYGRVINISSPDAFIGEVGMANYIAAKAGLFGLTVSVVHEFSRWVKEEGCNMTCNCLIVGYGRTKLAEEAFPKDISDRYASEIPLGRPIDPENDAGNAAAFLASERASYLTGAKMSVTGGLYACTTAY